MLSHVFADASLCCSLLLLPQCTLALRMPGSMKWQMVWELMTAGPGNKRRLRGTWDKLR